MEMIERVREMMAEKNVSQSGVARAIGIKQPSFSVFLNGDIEKPRFLPELAAYFGTTVEYLLNGDKKHKKGIVPPLPDHDLAKIVSIHGNVSAANGTIFGLADADGNRKLYIDIPHDCYAVEVSGDSMEPRYRHGEKLLIHPTLTVVKGMDVLIRLADGEGMVKTFKHEKAGVITYTQYFPKETDKTIRRQDIEALHAVLCRWG